jgi:hypothetical protein
MNIREFEFLHTLANERRAELEQDLAVEAQLADANGATEPRRHVLLSVTVAAILLVVIVASSAHLFL